MSPIEAKKNTYRPDIDGLRAIAVIVVILYHAEVAGFSGGFVGVDVFFVISGFLITGILARSVNEGSFSIIEFYERRARRILPALFAVIVLVLALAPLLIRPWSLSSIGRSVRYVVTSTANIDFYRKLGDYSGEDSSLVPFLHTWSLSVEEQFYIIIPILLLILAKFSRRPSHLLWMLVGITAISFAASCWTLPRDQSACFFLLPYRAWELTLGGILALLPIPNLTRFVSRLAGVCGIGMILVASHFFNHETPFPGPSALIPCAGAVLVILSGMGGGSPTFPTILLGSRPLVFVGLVSYSLYLIHWPALVFFRYQKQYAREEIHWWETALLLLIVVIASWASWRYVETPFRRSPWWTRRRIFIFAWSGIIALFGFGQFYKRSTVFMNLLPDAARKYVEFTASNYAFIVEAFLLAKDLGDPHQYGDLKVEPDTVIWGDSHAAVLVKALDELANKNNRSFVFYGKAGTPPVTQAQALLGVKADSRAKYSNEVYQKLIHDPTIRNVILAARWAFYTEGRTNDYGPAEKTRADTISKKERESGRNRQIELRSAFEESLTETVNGLRDAGKTVYLVYPVPELGYSIAEVRAIEIIEGRDPEKFTIDAGGVYHERTAPTISILDRVPQSDQLIRIRPEKLLIDGDFIRLEHEGKMLYSDGDHLSQEGALYIMRLFDAIFTRAKVE